MSYVITIASDLFKNYHRRNTLFLEHSLKISLEIWLRVYLIALNILEIPFFDSTTKNGT
jgi:hypothetical protein